MTCTKICSQCCQYFAGGGSDRGEGGGGGKKVAVCSQIPILYQLVSEGQDAFMLVLKSDEYCRARARRALL